MNIKNQSNENLIKTVENGMPVVYDSDLADSPEKKAHESLIIFTII